MPRVTTSRSHTRAGGPYGGKVPNPTAREEAALKACATWFAAAGWPAEDFQDSGLTAVDGRMTSLLHRVAAFIAGAPAATIAPKTT